MENDTYISVKNVSKKFSRSLKRSFIYGAQDILKSLTGIAGSADLRPSEFWALREISFKLKKGQSIGIIGLNGGGKTTLLRIISGILKPTRGEVTVNGKIAPMLALGAGFKPALSGRENVFLNMGLLGIPYNTILERFQDVVDFADIRDAIDAPLGTYSTGMRMRLGFSCAVHTDPTILVIDEVLSVGDAGFRAKCRNKINELRKSGTSMLLVSHSAISIEALCDECIYLKKGRIAKIGIPSTVLRAYEEDSIRRAKDSHKIQKKGVWKAGHLTQPLDSENHRLRLSNIRIFSPDADASGYWVAGQSGILEIDLLNSTSTKMNDISINIIVIDLSHHQGEAVQFFVSSKEVGWFSIEGATSTISLNLAAVGLIPGIYRIKLSVSQGDMHDILDSHDNIKLVVKNPGDIGKCLYYQPRDWAIAGGNIGRAPKERRLEEFVDDEAM